MDRNKYCTLTRNMYLKIFDKIDKYNRRIATTTAPLIRSVAIPPLGFGVYNTQNTNTASECLFNAIDHYRNIVTGEFVLYIPIQNPNDKETKVFMDDLTQRLRGLRRDGALNNNV